MAWTPIDLIVPQYVDVNGNPYSGAVLKAYQAGTSTVMTMATDSGGGTTFTSIALNSNGYPSNSGSICIPHVSANYKLALYATQAAADANTPAIWSIDNILQVAASGSFAVDDAVSSAVTNVITATHTTTGTPVAGIGTGIAFVTETAAGNNETGAVLQSVTTDVSAGSEDFDYVMLLMAAGAAAAEKFRFKSTGEFSTTTIKLNGTLLTPTAAQFNFVAGVTSAIQTQIDSKQATLVSGTNIKTINSTSLLGSGNITITTPGDHCVVVTTGNGWGAVNTKIRRFTTTQTNTGTDITYADSADNGGSFTINTTGLYEIALWDGSTGAVAQIGVSLNSAQLTTNIQSITAANCLFRSQMTNESAVESIGGAVFSLTAADVVRVHGIGASQLDSDVGTKFYIRKVGAV